MQKASATVPVMNGLIFLLTFLEEQIMGVKVDDQRKPLRRTIAGVDQEELLDPQTLADPDSRFYDFNGVLLHHKICAGGEDRPEQRQRVQNQCATGLPIILLHGFGASVFSWKKVMEPLASLVGSKVLAFDRPAFGLTSRADEYCPPHSASAAMTSAQLNPYSMPFSVRATVSFMDILEGEKTIIVGHSFGGLVAVNTYFEAPERVAALVLVSPAVVAPLVSSSISVKRKQASARDYETDNGDNDAYDRENMYHAIGSFMYACYLIAGRAIIGLAKVIMKLIAYFYSNMLRKILRTNCALVLVHAIVDKFGVAAVRASWYDPTQATQHDISGYTKPLRAKNWDKALLEFVIALLTHKRHEKEPSMKRKLSEITCPVLIITGDTDRVVPAWNAKRLWQAIPGSHLEVFKNCGHLPHEEHPQEFISVVNTFLSRSFKVHSDNRKLPMVEQANS